ncbi:hypothetical protein ACFU7Y_43485 [Kitasatospora sp. NPDC057542]|uniref:hypothetical protein n=1 Tax=Kitasatospora sp. NPDC057542 TaxID=3346162 RepID=UPI00369FBBE8
MPTQVLFLLAGLAITVLGFNWFVDGYHAVGAYEHAPVCGTAAATPGADCVLRETGKVTARDVLTDSDGGTTYKLTVAHETGPAHTYEVGEAFYDDANVGVDVDLAVFRGRVSEVSYDGHRSRTPNTPWLTSLKVALLVGLGAALTAHGLTRWRSGAELGPAAIGAAIVLFSHIGSLVLMTAQWPLAVTLGIAVLGWPVVIAAGMEARTTDAPGPDPEGQPLW